MYNFFTKYHIGIQLYQNLLLSVINSLGNTMSLRKTGADADS